MSYNLAFANYLRQVTDNDFFEVNLRDMSLLEVLEKRIGIKSKNNSNFGKQYSSLLFHIHKLEEMYEVVLMPKNVTDVFWTSFIEYLNDAGLAQSSIKTLASQLRATLEWASKHNAQVSSSFSDYELPTIEGHQIALTADEVSWIYHFDISTITRRKHHLANLEKVRDMFCLSCNLGQRYSDMIRVVPSCFEHNYFNIVQQKTGNKAKVNIDTFAIDKRMTYTLLEKYDYNAPYTRHLSNYDRYLKELMKYIGLDDLIKIEEKIQGKICTKYIPRYDLIRSHTARRTFATINVLRGKPVYQIRKCTGHKTERAFNRYICDDEDV